MFDYNNFILKEYYSEEYLFGDEQLDNEVPTTSAQIVDAIEMSQQEVLVDETINSKHK